MAGVGRVPPRYSGLMRGSRVSGRGEGWRLLPSTSLPRGPRPLSGTWRQEFRFATPTEVRRLEGGARRLSSAPVVPRLPRLQLGWGARARDVVLFLVLTFSRILHLRRKPS